MPVGSPKHYQVARDLGMERCVLPSARVSITWKRTFATWINLICQQDLPLNSYPNHRFVILFDQVLRRWWTIPFHLGEKASLWAGSLNDYAAIALCFGLPAQSKHQSSRYQARELYACPLRWSKLCQNDRLWSIKRFLGPRNYENHEWICKYANSASIRD